MSDANTQGRSPRGGASKPGGNVGGASPRGTPGPQHGIPDTRPGDGLSVPVAKPVASPLALEAIALARSADPTDHDRLAAMLLDTTQLDRLDSPELAQVAGPESLQLGLVLHEAAAHAPSVLDRLIASPLYAQPGHRQIALIDASAIARQPGKPLIEFWRSQLDPDADELESTIGALAENQSPHAMDVLAEAITSDAFDDELVFWWFRGPMLQRRQDAPLLSMIDQLLKSDRLNERRRAALVGSLFDYRPNDWYIATEQPPKPPAREKIDDRARALLRSIADAAVRLGHLDATQRERIETELAP